MTEQTACPRCQIGTLQPRTATYTSIHRGMVLSVPNTPMWKCDICQYTEYDYDTLARLEALTGRFGMPDDHAPHAAKLPAVDTEPGENSLPNRVKPPR